VSSPIDPPVAAGVVERELRYPPRGLSLQNETFRLFFRETGSSPPFAKLLLEVAFPLYVPAEAAFGKFTLLDLPLLFRSESCP